MNIMTYSILPEIWNSFLELIKWQLSIYYRNLRAQFFCDENGSLAIKCKVLIENRLLLVFSRGFVKNLVKKLLISNKNLYVTFQDILCYITLAFETFWY